MRVRSGFLLLLAGALLAVNTASPAASWAEDTPPTAAGAESFTSCLAGGTAGDVLLLIDETGSLKETDPENARIAAARHFVDQLTDAVEQSGSKVSLSIAAFGHAMRPVTKWETVTPEAEAGLLSAVDSFTELVYGFETDYWSALNDAREALSVRASERGEAPSCQSIVWFTDGEYWLSARHDGAQREQFGAVKPYAPSIELSDAAQAQRALDAGVADICRAGGLADQIRSSGLWLYGVGLGSGGDEPTDLSFMESIVRGADAGGKKCGEVPPRSGELFFAVNDMDGLLFAFDELASPNPISSEGAICADVKCPEKPHRVVLDDSLTQVRVLASAETPALPVLVESPDGSVTEIVPAAVGERQVVKLPAATITVETKSPTSMDLKIESIDPLAPHEGWAGLWQFAFVDRSGESDGKTSRANIHVRSIVSPTWTDQAENELRLGAENALSLGASAGNDDAHTFDLSQLQGTFEYVATLTTSDGKRHELVSATSAKDLAAPVPIDLSAVPLGAAALNLSLGITTAATKDGAGQAVAGTQLSPNTATFPVTVLPPLNYPEVRGRLDFGLISGMPEAQASLRVAGDGCVWIDETTAPTLNAAPDGIGVVSLTAGKAVSAETCTPVSGDTTFEVTFAAAEAGNGAVNGVIPVSLASATGEGEPLVVEVPFVVSLQKPVNTMNFWATLIAALILGPGIPLALLYLAKWFVSRIPNAPFVASRVRVTSTPSNVLRDGSSFSLQATDLRDIVAVDRGRQFSAQGLSFAVRRGWSPFGIGQLAVLESSPATAAPAGSNNAGVDASGVRAVLPLAVQNTWLAIRNLDGSEEVLVFATAGADPDTLRKLEERVRNEAPAVFEKLRRADPNTDASTPTPGGFPAPATAPQPAAPAFTLPDSASQVHGWGAPSAPTTGEWTVPKASPKPAGPSAPTPPQTPPVFPPPAADGGQWPPLS